MHDRAPIKALHEVDGVPIRALARDLGVSRNTVRRAVRGTPSTYRPGRSRLDEVEPLIRETLERYPLMPAAGVARRLRWDGSLSAFTARVRAVREQVAA